MSILRGIQSFIDGVGIELTGGFAIYFMLCTVYVTVLGIYGLIKFVGGLL